VELIDGNEYTGTPVSAEYGPNLKNGKPEAKLIMEIVEGDLKGLKVPYKANFKDTKAVGYSKRDMKAAGWQGKTIATFVADIAAAHKAGLKVKFKARLASHKRDDGTMSEWWTVGAIGIGEAPLGAPTNDMTKNVDSWFAEADEPRTARTDDSDLPF
jgi:hypothetical protein